MKANFTAFMLILAGGFNAKKYMALLFFAILLGGCKQEDNIDDVYGSNLCISCDPE